ncbi:MAG: hypothetical protein ACRC33_20500, partial [Gemmataceae bacterium]
RFLALLALTAFLLTAGCSDKPDPTKQPGFVDTTDPTKLKLPTLPKKGGVGGAGAGAPPPK